MSMFNPDEFLDQEILTQTSDKSVPAPVGEYTGIVESLKPRQWVAKDDPTKSGVALDILWSVEDEEVKALLGKDKVLVKQGVMLDIDDQGKLAEGKGVNVQLGRVRTAVGQNEEGQAFSFNMLIGQQALITVTHRIVGEDTYAEVSRAAKL